MLKEQMTTVKGLTVIFLLLLLLFACEPGNENENEPEDNEPLSIQQLQEDFMQLRNTLETNHPAIYMYDTQATMNAMFESAYNTLQAAMSELDFYRVLAPVVARVQCGHTAAYLSADGYSQLESSGRIFPYGLVFLDGHAYIYQDYSDGSMIPLGTEILAINQRSMATVLETLMAGISADGYNETRKLNRLNSSFSYLYYVLMESPESFTLDCRLPGEENIRVLQVDARLYGQVENSYSAQNPERELLGYQLFKDDGIALLTVSSFVIENSPDFRSFFNASFQDMITNQAVTLIIDVRDNSGGDPEFSADLIAYLINWPFTYFAEGIGHPDLFQPLPPHELNFSGNVFVLIDGGCFSATGHFCSLVKYHNLATFIGEETGGSFYCNDNSTLVTLSNSGIRVNIPRTTFQTSVTGFTWGRGIFPDITIRPTLADYIGGIDRVLEETLAMIRNNNESIKNPGIK